jgi:hypothetical protein
MAICKRPRAFCTVLFYAGAAVSAQVSPSVRQNVEAAYQREFGLTVEDPQIYNNPRAVNCLGQGHLTTTLYRSLASGDIALFSMYMSRDGTQLIAKHQVSAPLRPFGTLRVLTFLLHHPETVSDSGLAAWEAGQRQINADHAAFARQRGYSAPVVVFDNTNLLVSPTDVRYPQDAEAIRRSAALKGLSTDDYDVVIAIDIDPRKTAGGRALPSRRSIYVGNYGAWRSSLSQAQWRMVAVTAYHHEMAHLWGWPGSHDWSGSCGGYKAEYAPFIVPPVLLGWEDGDSDGVPDILRDMR